MKLENIGEICDKCARKLGFVPKDKTVGIWMGECEVCHERKPCTDLWHDWRKENKEVAK